MQYSINRIIHSNEALVGKKDPMLVPSRRVDPMSQALQASTLLHELNPAPQL